VLKIKIVEIVHKGRLLATSLRDRLSAGLAGRSRQVITLATLAGITAIGIFAATLDNAPSPSLTTAAANADLVRAEAAVQANRSSRDNPLGANTPISPNGASPPAAPAPSEAAPPPPPPPPPPAPKPDWVSPMPNGELTSCYGARWGTMHQGIDLANVENTPEFAVGAGTVFASGWNYSGYGISVVIDHHNGYLTHYAHMNKANVKVGDEVHAGDLIGWEGSTGDSTGPHLHFEVHHGMWNQVDPAPWLRDHGVNIGC
jgi:murein DD-endopeptidase MepM/ murein hydrolase activator NlpD